jgi:glycosyltransferase involved in cell wall biosynthesis
MSTEVDVSVVVPTRDRPGSLARCLDALSRQSGLRSFEIVVVDDGSDDANTVADVVGLHPGARIVRQGGAGPAAARNRGAREARGDIVCFTDDDCEPAPEWAARLGSAVIDGVDAVGGMTKSDPRNPFADATETITTYLQRGARRRSGTFFVPSNNLACRRQLLLELPFDERFPSASGEDRDWCARLAAAGGRIVFDPAAVVFHFPATGLAGFWRQHVRYGRGAYLLARTRSPRLRLQRPRFYVGLIRAGFARGIRCGLLVALAQVATALGFAREARSRRAEG